MPKFKKGWNFGKTLGSKILQDKLLTICNFRLCMVNYIILYKKFVEHHVIKLILLKISKLT